MESLLFARALLPEGWARDVRVIVSDGLLAAVEPSAAARAGEERRAIGLPTCTATPSSAAWQGWTSGAGQGRTGSGADGR